MKRKFWTQKEDDLLKTFISGKESWEDFADKNFPYRTTGSVMAHAMRYLGMNNKEYDRRTIFFDENVWKTLTPETCYWLGFLVTDGNLMDSKKERGYVLRLALQRSDCEQLEKFKKFTKHTGKVRFLKPRISAKGTIVYGALLQFNFKNYIWVDDLKKYGMVPRKTHILQPPQIYDDFLIRSFLVGAIDGDGSLKISNRENQSNKYISMSFACASLDFITWFKTQIEKIIGGQGRNIKDRNITTSRNIYHYSCQGLVACILIHHLRQYPVPRFSRKWDNPKILEIIEQKKSQFPDKFLTLKIPDEYKSLAPAESAVPAVSHPLEKIEIPPVQISNLSVTPVENTII